MNDPRFATTFRRLACSLALGAASVGNLHAQSAEDRLFDRLDRDGSGALDRGEIERTAAARRNPGLFERLDADADGLVSPEEFVRARTNAREAVEAAGRDAGAGTTMRWDVDGVERTALVRIPELAPGEQVPLVYVWHGHGGNARSTARKFAIHEHWPAAIVVHPQGLPTRGQLTDPEGLRSGWQTKGAAKDNRDLRFFDVMHEDLVGLGIVDPELVFSTGHSNGGGFTYTLFVERPDRLAAIAPSSSTSGRHRGRDLPDMPVFHLAGRNDELVRMAWQQATIDQLRRHFGCGDPEPWGDHPDCLVHPSPKGDRLVTCVHDGGHALPEFAGGLFTRFFKEHARSVRVDRARSGWTTPAMRAPRVTHHRFDSDAAGAEVSYHLYTPAIHDREPDRRLPVVYWLHGSGGGLPGIGPLARSFDAAIESGALPPCFVVFVNGLPQGMYVDWKDVPVPVESMIIKDLVPHIDATRPTIAEPEGRLIEGFSMGGYGAARLGFKHPDLFGAVSIMGAGPLQAELTRTPRASRSRSEMLLDTVYGGDQSHFHAIGPRALAERRAAELADRSLIRLVVGDRDETFTNNRGFHRHLEELGIDHEWVVLPGVGHDPIAVLEALGPGNWTFHRRAFADALSEPAGSTD